MHATISRLVQCPVDVGVRHASWPRLSPVFVGAFGALCGGRGCLTSIGTTVKMSGWIVYAMPARAGRVLGIPVMRIRR